MAFAVRWIAGRRARTGILVAYVVLAFGDVGAELADLQLLIFLLPLVLMPLLVAYLMVSVRQTWTTAALAAGQLFAWFGDAFALSPLTKIGFFIVTQLAYSAIFAPRWRRSLVARRRLLLAYGVPMLAVVAAVGLHAGSLAAPVIVYGLLVTSMVALASGMNRLCCAGAVLFLISDITLGYQLFVAPPDTPVLGGIVMATYLAGQLLITLGVIRRLRTRERAGAELLVSAAR